MRDNAKVLAPRILRNRVENKVDTMPQSIALKRVTILQKNIPLRIHVVNSHQLVPRVVYTSRARFHSKSDRMWFICTMSRRLA